MLPQTVDANDGRVGVLVFDIWSDRAYTDAHGTDEDEGIKVVPLTTHIRSLYAFGIPLTLEHECDVLASLVDLYDCYLLHVSISIG